MKTKPLVPGRTEAQVLAQVLEAAAMFGLDVQRQNTGAALNPRGQMVRFGTAGDADLKGVLPDGRALYVEIKHENFDPTKLRGEKKAHFDRQVARLRRTNELGGVAFWIDDVSMFVLIIKIVLDGGTVEEPGYDRVIVRPRGR
jgi:hypothetical protein